MLRSELSRIRELRATISALVRDHGADDPRTIEARLSLAGLYQNDLAFDDEQQRWEDLSYEQLLHVFHSRRRTLGPLHDDTLAVQNRLIIGREQTGHLEAVDVSVLRHLATSREQDLGSHHPETLRVLVELARRVRDREAECAALWDRIIDGRERLLAERERELGPDDPRTSAVRIRLAGDISEEHPEKALRLRRQAIASWARVAAERSRRLGPVHPETVAARRRHADLHSAFGGPAGPGEATRMIEEITVDHERILGLDDPRTMHAQVELARHYGWADPRTPAYARPLLDRLYTAPEPDYEDVTYVRYLLTVDRARVGDEAGMRALLDRYPVPDDSDDDLQVGDPDYPASDEDV
ncbi:hypothetical protein ACQP2X_18065 [Actinoplanes sp. CA-131856]